MGNISSCNQMLTNDYSNRTTVGYDKLGSLTTQCDFTEAFQFNELISGIITISSLITKISIRGLSLSVLNKCTGLRLTNAGSLFAGTSPQIDISHTSLDAASISLLFGDLPTLTGKTIRITGATGAADTSNDAIATAKGWTINRTT